MADGKVTIDVDLNDGKALSGASKVKGLLNGLTSAGEKAGSVFKSMLGANIIGGAVTAGIGALTGQISGLVGDINASSKAWQTFRGNMENLGLPKQEIAGVKKELQSFATETIYSASDMASTYSQLAAVGIKSTKELVTGFGGLAAAAENPGQAMKTLSTQAVQMAAKPTVAWADFKLMLEQTPAGISAVAKHMGMSTAEMVTAVQDGKIATQDFFDAINAVGNNDTFRKMATEYKTVDQAIDGLTEGVSNKLLPAFEVLSKHGIKAVEGVISIVDKFDGDGFASQIDKWAQSFQGLMQGFSDLGVFNNFKATLSSIGDMFQSVFKIDPGILNTGVVTVSNILNGLMYVIQDISAGISSFFEGFTNSGAVRALALAFFDLSEAGLDLSEKLSGAIPWETIGNAAGQVVKFIAEIISAIAQFSQKVDGNIFRGLLIGIPAAIAGFKAFDFLKFFNPFSFFKKNATDGVGGAGEAVKRSKSTISQVFTGLSNVIKSSGTAIKTAATGIGTGIKTALSGVGPVLRAFGAMLRTAGVANILAFGGAIGIAAVGIGAGIGIIVASFALLATQSAGISQIISTISDSLGSLASTIIGALAQAFVTIAPYLPIVATAFAQLSPLITATGSAIASIISAFASLSPVILAFGTAFSMVVSAVGGAVSQIIVAATPLVAVLGSVLTTTVQIVSTAIVQIVQALAPVVPAITEMVVAIAPVLQSMVEAFTTLITNLSPIIDSLTNLVTGLGDSIRNVLDGAKGVIESFGNAVSSILDSVAGMFDSIGNAALNAGKGFNQLAQGIERITKLNLLDMGASLAAVAAGLGAIGATSGGLASASSALTSIIQGLARLQSESINAQNALGMIGPVASRSMSMISQGVQQAVSATVSGMLQIVNVIRLSANQMIQAGKQAGDGTTKGVVTGIRSGIGQAGGAMHAMMTAIRDTGMQGVGAMQSIGAYIAQGLAQGMYSALGTVTAAANALVAQAERAAQAKAKIHSPSRLFRDNVGRYIAQGIAVGIEQNTSDVTDSLAYVQKEMSAFKFGAEELLGLGNGSLSSQFRFKYITERAEMSQIKIIRDQADQALTRALEVAEQAVKRPVNMVLDDGTLVAKIGQPMTNYQNDKLKIDNMMRGIV